MTHDRGDYRSIYGALWRGKDFRRLAKDPRWLLVALRHNLGAAGIRALDAPDAMMMAWTALTTTELSEALRALVDSQWVEHEENVIWVIRGLEFEPNLEVSNKLHRVHIQKHIGSLPRLPIVNRFRGRYPEWFEGAVPSALDTSIEVQENLKKASRSTETATTLVGREHGLAAAAAPEGSNLLESTRAATVALNRGMLANPAIGQRLNPVMVSAGEGMVKDWLTIGIPLPLICDTVEEAGRSYRPRERRPQIHGLSYCDRAVKDAWERHVAGSAAASSTSTLPRRKDDYDAAIAKAKAAHAG